MDFIVLFPSRLLFALALFSIAVWVGVHYPHLDPLDIRDYSYFYPGGEDSGPLMVAMGCAVLAALMPRPP